MLPALELQPENLANTVNHYLFAHQDVPLLLKQWAEQTPDNTFMIWEPKSGEDKRWTFAEFWQDANRIACGLLAQGVKKGDKVLIHSDNSPEMVLSWYASAIVGSVGVTTNTRCVGDELTYFAEHSDAIGCITQPQYIEALSQHANNLQWFYVTEDDSGTPPSVNIPNGQHIFPFANLSAHGEQAPERTPEPMLPIGIQYTSGTTSRPKAVVHTHANALWGGRSGAQNLQMTPDDVYLTFLPFFHVNAQSWCVWSSLWVGAAFVLQPKFSASRFWEVSLKHQCTRASMLPFCFKAIGPQPVPDHQYKTWSTGVIIPEVEEWFKVRTFATWSMTEMVTHATRSDIFQTSPKMNIGVPAPGYEFAIIDDKGELCDPGVNGDLHVRGIRGIQLFFEYYKNPEAMKKSFTTDGWFKTGDRARLGTDGHFYFADRDKDVLKVGGENVSARQVEEMIMALGGFDEVAVVAQKHDMLDEVPVVFAIKSPWTEETNEQLIAKVMEYSEANLADFKRPRAMYMLDEFPRATLEKVAKNKLREMADELAD